MCSSWYNNSVTLYKLLTRSILPYAAPVCSSTCFSNNLILQVFLSKYLRVFGNHPRSSLTSNLHYILNTEHLLVIIHRLTAKFFALCHPHPNPPVQQIGNYTLADLTYMYRKYKHKRTKHVLL